MATMSDMLVALAMIAEESSLTNVTMAQINYLWDEGYIRPERNKWIPTQAGVDLLADYNWVG